MSTHPLSDCAPAPAQCSAHAASWDSRPAADPAAGDQQLPAGTMPSSNSAPLLRVSTEGSGMQATSHAWVEVEQAESHHLLSLEHLAGLNEATTEGTTATVAGCTTEETAGPYRRSFPGCDLDGNIALQPGLSRLRFQVAPSQPGLYCMRHMRALLGGYELRMAVVQPTVLLATSGYIALPVGSKLPYIGTQQLRATRHSTSHSTQLATEVRSPCIDLGCTVLCPKAHAAACVRPRTDLWVKPGGGLQLASGGRCSALVGQAAAARLVAAAPAVPLAAAALGVVDAGG